ncbi:hypothetical protein SBRCBS47491_003957 [Sporothrix bragantina]|uniref:Zn(2)-C6 fungal-type domain-containing protein n=1 Tax=Sporothrix bragantina TaxID=671064 RepID=A0ABP0BJI7_9PEZI
MTGQAAEAPSPAHSHSSAGGMSTSTSGTAATAATSVQSQSQPQPQSQPAPSLTSTTNTNTTSKPPHPKRIRLNLACNNCRRRKVKCDTEQPKCRNCWLRDEECETTDPRYANSADGRGARLEVRRWATANGLMPGQHPAATHRNHALVAKHGPGPAPGVDVSPTACGGPAAVSSSVSVSTASPSSRLRRGSTTQSIHIRSPSTTSPLAHETRSSARGGSGMTTSAAAHGESEPQGPVISWVSRGYHDAENAANAENEDSEDTAVVDAATNAATTNTTDDNGTSHATTHSTGDYDADVVLNTDSSPHRVKYMGGSSLQCLAGFVDIFLRRRRLPLISPAFTNGMRQAEEFSLPLAISIPPLPPLATAHVFLESYFDRVWPLFPVVYRSTVEQDLQRFHTLEQSLAPGTGLQSVLVHDDIPSLVVLLAVLAIGADESSAGEGVTDIGMAYVTAGFGLCAHLMAMPYLRSVQGLFLLALALRLRVRDGQAWHLVGQAVRIAHSIGLHRRTNRPNATQTNSAASVEHAETGYRADQAIQSRVWWSLYALEKVMELETGRPSAISDDDVVDQPLQPFMTHAFAASPTRIDVFTPWVSLAKILSQITRRLYIQKPSSASVLMHEIDRLDTLLLQWAEGLPAALQPGHDTIASMSFSGGGETGDAVLASFLALQYYHAQMAILRAAIVFPIHTFATEAKKAFGEEAQGAPGTQRRGIRLLQGESLCTSAARATAHRVLELADHGLHTHVLSPTYAFQAAIVLSLHILRSPGKRMVRSDLELLISITQHLETQYARCGQHPGFVRGLETLRTSVAAAVEQYSNGNRGQVRPSATGSVPGGTSMPTTVNTVVDPRLGGTQHMPMPLIDPGLGTGYGGYDTTGSGMMLDMAFFDFDGDNLGHLEEFWSALGPPDFMDHGHLDHPGT